MARADRIIAGPAEACRPGGTGASHADPRSRTAAAFQRALAAARGEVGHLAGAGAAGECLGTLAEALIGRRSGAGSAAEGPRIEMQAAATAVVPRDLVGPPETRHRAGTSAGGTRPKLPHDERFVEAILAATEALIVVLDRSGRVERFNGACERASGYSAAEVLGRIIWDLVIPAAEVADVRATFADLRAGSFPNSHENHWQTASGEQRVIRWENTCLTDDAGIVTHVIGTGIDITDARRRDEALSGIEVVGRLLTDQGPSEGALDAILGELEQRMGYRLLSLYLADSQGLHLGAQRGYSSVPECLGPGSGIIGRVSRTGVAELVRDVVSDPDYVRGEARVASEIAAPLLGDGTTLGVLNIEASEPGQLTPDDLRLARAVADSLSSALRRGRTQEVLRDRVRLFAALADFAVAVNAILDPERLASALADAVRQVVPADTVLITLLDRSDGKFRVSAVRGMAPGAIGAVIEPGLGTAGRAISERAVVEVDRHPNAQGSTALHDYVRFQFVRTLGVPLIHNNVVVGVISVGRADVDARFTQSEREVFEMLGSHAALALANAYLIAEVSSLAIHDGLTGLYNRRHFDVELDHAIARVRRRGPPANLAAIMFDLDHFGEFNRRHGHLIGDAVLRQFAGVLRERLRSADLVARYGGEEFVVILEDCPLPGAVLVAEQIRKGLEATAVPGAEGKRLHVTVSAGCAVIDPADATREALIGRADVGLFMAKRAGRNQVVAA